MNSLQREIMIKIIVKCKNRIKKQIRRLKNKMRYIYEHYFNHFICSKIVATNSKNESTKNIEHFDNYCEMIQKFYMHFCEIRMTQFKKFLIKIIDSSIENELDFLIALKKLVYNFRHLSVFKHFIQINLNRQFQSNVSLSTVSNIIDRIEQILKIYRAVLNITTFVIKMKEFNKKIISKSFSSLKLKSLN